MLEEIYDRDTVSYQEKTRFLLSDLPRKGPPGREDTTPGKAKKPRLSEQRGRWAICHIGKKPKVLRHKRWPNSKVEGQAVITEKNQEPQPTKGDRIARPKAELSLRRHTKTPSRITLNCHRRGKRIGDLGQWLIFVSPRGLREEERLGVTMPDRAAKRAREGLEVVQRREAKLRQL